MKKNTKKTVPPASFSQQVRDFWQQKRPIFYFVGAFALLMGCFYAFWLSSFFEQWFNPVIMKANTTCANILLQCLGQSTRIQADLISSDTFSISIKKGCDAVEAMALFSVAILAFPMNKLTKIKALTLGLLSIFLMNLVRIVTLFLVGRFFPSHFETFHIEIFPLFFVIFSLALWLFFIVNTPLSMNEKETKHTM